MPKATSARKAMAMEMPKSESTQCPLCCEDMDMTDLSFLPCPCGYRVCLFCVQQIKLHCRNQCPGCRREYGTVPVEAGPAASSASANTQEPHLVSLSSTATSHHGQQEATSSAFQHPNSHGNNNAHSSSHTHHHNHHNSNSHSSYASSGPPRPPPPGLHGTLARGGSGGGGGSALHHPPKPPPTSASMHERLKRAAEHSSAARREEAASSGASVGLPSGATWATQAITKQQHQQHLHQQEMEQKARQQAAAPVVTDETAWPSLADTMQPAAPAASSSSNSAQAQQQQKEQQAAQKQAAQQQQIQQLRQVVQQQQQQRQREAQAQREREREQQAQQAQREREREQQAQQAQREREREQQQQQQQQQLSQRPSLSANNSMDRVASSSSIEHMSQDPVVPPEQLGLQHGRIPQPPFALPGASSPAPGLSTDSHASHTAHFTTHVQGLSRNVAVPLPASAAVEPYPEALPLLASLSSGVKAGGIDSKDAATQLVALLKHKEAQQGRMQSLLAAGRAPPGFAVPQQQQQQPQTATGGAAPAPPAPPAAPPSSNGCLTPMDSPVIPTPSIGRYQPIGKPIGPTPQQQQQQQLPPPQPQSNGNSLHPLQSTHSAHSMHPPYVNGGTGTGLGTYSMWSGLPGIDLTPTYSPLGSSMWSGLGSCAPPGVDPAAPVSSAFAQPQAPTTAAPTPSSRPPPPGFGGPSYTPGLLDASAAAAKAGAAAGYRPLGVLPGETRYNPLNPLNFQSSFGTNTSPSSVSQFSAYRPQLL